MKRIIMTVALVATMCIASVNTACAQTFKDSFKQMLKMGVMSDPSAELTQMLPQAMAGGLDQGYVKDQIADDIMDIVAPYYEKYLTVEDINMMCKEFEKPEVKAAFESMRSVSSNLGGISQDISQQMMQVFMGQTPDPVALKKDIDKEYVDLCADFSKDTGLSASFDVLFDMMKKIPNQEMEEKISILKNYVVENIPTILANACHGKVSITDLRTQSALNKTPMFQHMYQGNTEVLRNAETLVTEIMKRMEAYKNTNSNK